MGERTSTMCIVPSALQINRNSIAAIKNKLAGRQAAVLGLERVPASDLERETMAFVVSLHTNTFIW